MGFCLKKKPINMSSPLVHSNSYPLHCSSLAGSGGGEGEQASGTACNAGFSSPTSVVLGDGMGYVFLDGGLDLQYRHNGIS